MSDEIEARTESTGDGPTYYGEFLGAEPMSDIVERARESDGFRVVKNTTGDHGWDTSIKADTELINELADEIERLRAEMSLCSGPCGLNAARGD